MALEKGILFFRDKKSLSWLVWKLNSNLNNDNNPKFYVKWQVKTSKGYTQLAPIKYVIKPTAEEDTQKNIYDVNLLYL